MCVCVCVLKRERITGDIVYCLSDNILFNKRQSKLQYIIMAGATTVNTGQKTSTSAGEEYNIYAWQTYTN